MASPFLPGRTGSCAFTVPLPLTNIVIQPGPHTTKMPPPKPKPRRHTGRRPTTTNPLLTAAPIHHPWTPVLDPRGAPIPYLQQTTVPNFPVRKGAQSAPTTKTVRLLLLTHSDGGKLIHDHAGFSESQYCLPGHPRYLGLMCQLGEQLAKNLGIGSSGGNGSGNKPADAVWDVLVQLPLKYNAYYKARSGGDHLDLYIVGHDFQKFDSVKQYALHLAWLAVEDDGGVQVRCECKVCREERKKVSLAKQAERKSRWAEHSGPVMKGVPDWRA
jgi:hypothetical protein